MAQPNIDPKDIEYIRANPQFAPDYDKIYGDGWSARQLGQTQDNTGPDGSVREQEDDGGGFWDHVSEIPSAVVTGATRSIDATANWLSRNVGSITFVDKDGNFDIQLQSGDDVERLMREGHWGNGLTETIGLDAPKTFTGQAVQGVSQFTVGFVGVGKFFKAGKLFSNISKGKQALISNVSRGAVADFAAFEGKEGNLSDWLHASGVDNALVNALMTDPDDSDTQNRLRNAIEGAGIGLAVDGIIKVIRAAGYLKRGDTEKAQQLGAEGADEIENGVKGKVEEVNAQNAAEAESVPLPPAGAVDEAAQTPPKVETETPEGQLFPETVDEAIDRAARENEQVAGYKDDLSNPDNPNTFPVFREIVDRILQGAAYRNRQTGNVARPGDLARNLRYVTDPEDIQDVIATVGREDGELAAEFAAVKGGEVERWSTLQRKMHGHAKHLGDLFGEDWQALVSRFGDVPKTAEGQVQWANFAADLQAKRHFVDTMSEEIQNIGQIWTKWVGKQIDEQDLINLGWKSADEFELDAIHMTELYANLEASFRGQRAAVGRAMNAQKMIHKRGGALTEALRNQAGRSRSAMTKYFRDVEEAALKGEAAPSASSIGGVWDKLNTFRINMMLSGPNTQIINAVSNMMNAHILMLEQTIGGAVRLSPTEMIRGVKQLGYTYGSALEAIRMAGFAARQDQSILDAVGGKLEVNTNPFGGEKFSLVDKEGRSIRGAANLIATLPSRMLLLSDEFFKQATYRGKLKADLWVAGRNKGLKGDELNKFIADAEKRSFDADGAAAALDEGGFRMALEAEGKARGLDGDELQKFISENADQVNASKAALDTARESTFTTELEGFSAQIQALAVHYPSVRFILPFVKTPTNLLLAAGRRTPVLNILSKKLRADLQSPNPSVRSQAMGKVITGWAVVTAAGMMASEGRITGSGPSNPRTRAAWMATGWRPYSFVINNEDGSKSYISYQRYDPFSNFFGVAADLVEVMKEAELEGKKGSESRITDIATGLFQSIAENSINKTYLRGLSDMMGAITAPDKNMERFLASTMASYTPAAIGQLDGDEVFREARGILDQTKNRAAAVGLGEFSDPKRNQLGEMVYRQQDKWNPFTLSTSDPNDIVLQELAMLGQLTGKNFSTPRDRTMGTLEDFSLVEYKNGQSVYDKYLELTGTVKISGQTLRQRLARVIPRLQRMNPGTRDHPDSPRAQVIGRIFQQYRDVAKHKLRREGRIPNAPKGVQQFHKAILDDLEDKKNARMKRGNEFNLKDMIRGN